MLKKFAASFATLVLALIGFATLSLTALAPATAGVPLPEKITYCQVTGNGSYHPVTANVRSLVDTKGTLKQGGINENDIVGPFSWDFGGDDHGNFLGSSNWNSIESQNFIDRGCVSVDTRKLVQPPTPIYTPGTCSDIDGSVSEPTSEGSSLTYSRVTGDLAATWVVHYGPTEGYKYADGVTGTYTFPVVGPDSSDSLWDSAKGICRMPDTGAGSIKSEHILYAGILIFAGLLLTTLARRKA